MSSLWGRPPRKEVWQDVQTLAFWILLIGVGAFILFPKFFGDVYARLTDPFTQTVDTTGSYNPGYAQYDIEDIYTSTSYDDGTSYLSSGSYSTSPTIPYLGNEVASGYWVLFVAEGDFKQLSVTYDTYTFLLRLIEKDLLGEGRNTLILVANGQIKKFTVTNEIYQIVTNLAAIDKRAKLG